MFEYDKNLQENFFSKISCYEQSIFNYLKSLLVDKTFKTSIPVGYGNIALNTGLSKSTVIKYLKELESKKFITTGKTTTKGKYYSINFFRGDNILDKTTGMRFTTANKVIKQKHKKTMPERDILITEEIENKKTAKKLADFLYKTYIENLKQNNGEILKWFNNKTNKKNYFYGNRKQILGEMEKGLKYSIEDIKTEIIKRCKEKYWMDKLLYFKSIYNNYGVNFNQKPVPEKVITYNEIYEI